MDRYRRYSGVLAFILAVVFVCIIIGLFIVKPRYENYKNTLSRIDEVTQELENKRTAQENIKKKLAKLKESIITSQKKIYSPIESDLGDDTLFFTLYRDLIEMVHSNSIKIDSIDYKYNPDGDEFVKQGSTYFVCDVNLKLVSNYVNLGKLIQDIYQYPYYLRINNIEVLPYPKDKKILLTTMSVRLYAHTKPDEVIETEADNAAAGQIEGASTPIPKE